jgi:hypothetical protein
VGLVESGINSRAGARAKVDNNYFKNSKDVLGTFYTTEAGTWQVSGNIFDNVTWSARSSDNNPAGPNVQSTTTVSIPYSFRLDGANCVPSIVAQTAGANKGMQVSNGSCTPTTPSSPAPGPSSPGPGPSSPGPSSPAPSQPSGTNLSIGAGSDGSSKASGTSYGDVRDGNMGTYWSPSGSTGDISIKWGSATSVSRINIREAAGSEGRITGWQVINSGTGGVLASGTRAGVITFGSTSLRKITFRITSSTGAPRVAEFETYAS